MIMGLPGKWGPGSWHRTGDTVHASAIDSGHIGQWPWPTFNIADSMLVCGAILLIGELV